MVWYDIWYEGIMRVMIWYVIWYGMKLSDVWYDIVYDTVNDVTYSMM